jgi:hypothetical protein
MSRVAIASGVGVHSMIVLRVIEAGALPPNEWIEPTVERDEPIAKRRAKGRAAFPRGSS